MYTASDEASLSGAWTPVARQTPVRNLYQEVPVIRWSELQNRRHLADGAMCSCYTAEYQGATVVIKKANRSSREVRWMTFVACRGEMNCSEGTLYFSCYFV